MLRKKRLEEYVLRRCERIRNCLHSFCLGRNPEALHQLRVEVKRLKALASLLQACTGRNGRKVRLDVVRPLYRHAACIRSAQVNLLLLEEYGLHEERFEQEQRAVLAAEPDRFCARNQEYHKRIRILQGRLIPRVSGIKGNCIRTFFRRTLEALNVFFTQHFGESGLHEARKRLKNLLYLYALLPHSLAASIPLNVSYLDRLQHLIGRWHDAGQAPGILSGAMAQDTLLDQLRAEERYLLEVIRSLSGGFLEKATSPDTGEPVPGQ